MVGLNAGGEKVIGSSQCFSTALRIEIHFSFSVSFSSILNTTVNQISGYIHIYYTPQMKN